MAAWGTRIFQLAEARGWGYARLAREMGVGRVTLWRLRAGVGEPSPSLMRKAYTLFPDAEEPLFWPLPEPVEVSA
jgi:transcriptional regulator with XRE-family HTH domain